MSAVVRCVIAIAVFVPLSLSVGCKGKDAGKPAAGKSAVGKTGLASDAGVSASVSEFKPVGAFARDVQRICDATARSGALEQEPAYRPVTVAQWLAQKIESQDGRDLLGRVARLAPKAKAKALRDAALKIGMSDCRTAAAWTGTAP